MTQPNFRALAQELVEKLDELTCNFNVPNQSALIERVLNELDTPPPKPPTDEELMALAVTVFENPFATDKDYARAVLERWGKK